MVEEFAFILCHVPKDDRDGALVLGHELLLLAHSHCHRKRGSRHTGATPLERLPTCSFQTLEQTVLVPDTIQLEHLAWAVFDNIMGPGEAPPLSGFETYNQIIGRLASKAYKGVHTRCPAHRSTSFGTEVKSSRWKVRTLRSIQDPGIIQWHGKWEKSCGVVLCFYGKTTHCGKRPIICTNASSGPQHPGNEMDERMPTFLWRCGTGILFVIETLMNRDEEPTHQLAHRLLSVWHWSSAVDPPTYRPAPTSMNIGYWLCERTMKTSEALDRGLCVYPTMHCWSLCGSKKDSI